jgi:biopolymer transport protein ExbD
MKKEIKRIKKEEKKLESPCENCTLYKTFDNGKTRVWISHDDKIDYESLYKVMAELNEKLAGA